MNDADLLKYAFENGIINRDTIQMHVDMSKRQKYLEMHEFKIWQSETDLLWRTYLPDDKKGRVLKKRKTYDDIVDLVVDYYKIRFDEEKLAKEREKMTLLMLFPKWLDYKTLHTNSSSYITRILSDWKKYYAGEKWLINVPLHKLTKMDLDNWAHGMIKSKELTKKQYYNMSMILRQCLDYAVECGCVDSNVFSEVKINTKMFRRVKKKTSETQVYNQYEEEELIQDMIRRFNNNPTSTAPLAVMFIFETGLRIGEVCAVQYTDIEGRYIHIQRQEIREFDRVSEFKMKFKGFKVVDYAKTDDGYRDVYLTDTALKIIEITRIINDKCKDKNPNQFIFFKDGNNINHYSIQAMIKRGCEFINIDIKTSHKIRKTYISTLIDSGLNIDEIRRMVGHSDERTTYGNYCFNRLTSKQTEETLEKALDKKKVIKGNQLFNIIEFQKNPVKSGAAL